MITPSKVTPLRRSILHKLPILIELIDGSIDLIELHEKSKKEFSDVGEFITTLNVLYILDKVSWDEKSGIITKC